MANGRKKAIARHPDKNIGNSMADYMRYKMQNLRDYINKIDSITNPRWTPLVTLKTVA